jgi:hypothetical protein
MLRWGKLHIFSSLLDKPPVKKDVFHIHSPEILNQYTEFN